MWNSVNAECQSYRVLAAIFVLRLEHCTVFLFPQCQPPRCGSTLSLDSCPPIGAGYNSFVSFHFIKKKRPAMNRNRP